MGSILISNGVTILNQGGTNWDNQIRPLLNHLVMKNKIEDVTDYVRQFIINSYGPNVPINYDAIDVYMHMVVDQNAKAEYQLRYKNLYSYVILNGIAVPYYDWIYEDFYAGPKYIYEWRGGPGNDMGFRKDRAAYEHIQKLQAELRERDRMEKKMKEAEYYIKRTELENEVHEKMMSLPIRAAKDGPTSGDDSVDAIAMMMSVHTKALQDMTGIPKNILE